MRRDMGHTMKIHRTIVGGFLALVLTATGYFVYEQFLPLMAKNVMGATWAQLPGAAEQTSWRTAYIWIGAALVGGLLLGALALWYYRLRDRELDSMSQDITRAPRTALEHLRRTTNTELRAEVLTEIVEAIVAGRPKHQKLCREILQTLISGECNVLKLVDWGDCGLTSYGRQNLIRDLRAALVDDLETVAIPTLLQLEEKLRNTRDAVGNTHRRLARRGLGRSSGEPATPIEPEKQHVR
jgi:hypothetical protein